MSSNYWTIFWKRSTKNRIFLQCRLPGITICYSAVSFGKWTFIYPLLLHCKRPLCYIYYCRTLLVSSTSHTFFCSIMHSFYPSHSVFSFTHSILVSSFTPQYFRHFFCVLTSFYYNKLCYSIISSGGAFPSYYLHFSHMCWCLSLTISCYHSDRYSVVRSPNNILIFLYDIPFHITFISIPCVPIHIISSFIPLWWCL